MRTNPILTNVMRPVWTSSCRLPMEKPCGAIPPPNPFGLMSCSQPKRCKRDTIAHVKLHRIGDARRRSSARRRNGFLSRRVPLTAPRHSSIAASAEKKCRGVPIPSRVPSCVPSLSIPSRVPSAVLSEKCVLKGLCLSEPMKPRGDAAQLAVNAGTVFFSHGDNAAQLAAMCSGSEYFSDAKRDTRTQTHISAHTDTHKHRARKICLCLLEDSAPWSVPLEQFQSHGPLRAPCRSRTPCR